MSLPTSPTRRAAEKLEAEDYRIRNGDPLEMIDATLAATQPCPFSLTC
jgi:hypothetical protein